MSERNYLAELMSEFPSEISDVDESLALLAERYQKLLRTDFVEKLSNVPKDELYKELERLIVQVHRTLYSNILSNAGQFRSVSDHNDGRIFFGTNGRFEGTLPQNIAEAISDLVGSMEGKDVTSPYYILHFYQRFVQIHPFDDANGRIGRLIVSICLRLGGKHIRWGEMQKNNKWLKRLNSCHSRFGGHDYEEYLDLLVNQWQKFIEDVGEIEEE